MGIHTAEPTLGGERYVGLGVHRAARICAVGHGGQILLSHTAHDLLEDEEQPQLVFRDLGEHRLKDFDRPERIFQVGEGDFPPLRSLQDQPAEATPFDGRENDLVEAAQTVVTADRRFRRRALLAGALAGVIAAAIAIPIFAFGQRSPGGEAGAESGKAAAFNAPKNSVVAIDPKTNRAVGAVSVGTRPIGIAFGEGSVWVANVDDNTVTRIDAATRRVEDTIGVGAPPTGIAFGEGAVWVASGFAGTVTRIDPSGNAVGSPIRFRQLLETSSSLGSRLGGSPLGGGSVWATIAAGSGAAWVADRKNFKVVRIDPTASSRAGQMKNVDPQTIVVDGDFLWVIDYAGGRIVEIDVQSSAVVAAIPFDIDSTPKALAVGFATVWAADTDNDQLMLIRPPTTAIASTIPVDDGPAALTIANESVWVGHWLGESVWRVDPHSHTVVATIKLGRNVGSLTTGGGYVWAAVT